ncbi:MAG: phospholipid carrier-dependent glycosyltransferase [Proteobacteria bacterium]|nr:phospholipid carrier-dependent glycosyltransferase [Pseudomonadota bacterium]
MVADIVRQEEASGAAKAHRRVDGWTAAVFLAAAAAMALLALTLPVDHDEGQYVAAALASASGLRPYADYVYLQTPLQPLLTAPIAEVARGSVVLALRLANAAAGAGILALVFQIQRGLGVERRRAAAATALLGACYIFQFACGVARNDALAALAEMVALAVALRALETRRAFGLWVVAGLALGAAVSLKLSYALPAAAAGLFVVQAVWARRLGWRALGGLILGGLAGGAPYLWALASAPRAVLYDTVLYHQTAPRAWYAAIGQAGRLGVLAKVPDSLLALAVGPALEVLVAVAIITLLRWRERTDASPRRRLIEVMALAGLAAALAPAPTQRQYFLPLLPCLFILWGIGESGLARALPWRRALAGAVAAGALIGAGRVTYLVTDSVLRIARGAAPPILALQADGRWVGARLRAAGAKGAIATPSPQAAADSGYDLDPRLAAGPFFYRTGDLTSDADQARLKALSPRTLAAGLDAAPPAAILVGLEGRPGLNGRSADDDFRDYAVARGWRSERSPDGALELYLRPVAGGRR